MRFAQEISVFNPFAIEKKIIGLSTSITQTSQKIELQAQELAVVNGKVETATASLSVMARQIESKVEDSTFNSAISQLSNQITSKVSRGDVVSVINQSADQITISSNRIKIDSTYFHLTTDGQITATRGIIGNASASSSNKWTIGGDSSRAWIYSGSKSSMSSTQNGIYIGTDGIEVRVNGSSTASNSWTKITGGVTETTQLKIYDGGGSRYGTMVISDETRDLPSGRNDYYRIGFTNGIVTGAIGEDRGGNLFLNRTWCYNNFYARRDVTFGDNDEPGSSDYGRFYLYQNGTYYADWSPGSDRRLKKNISHINHKKARDFILALKPSEYQLVHVKDGRYHHGFIAQEVEEIGWDGLVGHDKQHDNMRSLAYIEIIPDIVAVLQDLIAEREG